MLFYAKKLLTALVLPPTSLLVLALVGLALMAWGRRRLGMAVATFAILTLTALSLPIVAAGLTVLVGDADALDPTQIGDAQAIVILGGGLRRNATEYGGDTPGQLTLARVRYGATLAKRTGLPVLVTGGRVHRGRAEAEVMREVLEREFSVPVRWVESNSRNTHENAILSVPLLRAAGVNRALLVTHGVDARRARREFAAAGLDVTVAPTVIPRWAIHSPLELLPSTSALDGSTLALYELLANVAVTLGLSGA